MLCYVTSLLISALSARVPECQKLKMHRLDMDGCQGMTENSNNAACMYNIYSFIKQN